MLGYKDLKVSNYTRFIPHEADKTVIGYNSLSGGMLILTEDQAGEVKRIILGDLPADYDSPLLQ